MIALRWFLGLWLVVAGIVMTAVGFLVNFSIVWGFPISGLLALGAMCIVVGYDDHRERQKK